MHVTQIDNRRIAHLRAKLDRARFQLNHTKTHDIHGKYLWDYRAERLRLLMVQFTYHLDQQSARLARFIHRPSFAGVPAAPPATYRHSFMTRWGDLTDITKAELPYKERRERYISEIKRNLNSWHGLPPRPYRGPRAKIAKGPKATRTVPFTDATCTL